MRLFNSDLIHQDPRGSRMVQWKGLGSVCCGEGRVCAQDALMSHRPSTAVTPSGLCVHLGIVNMSFPLSDQPVFGEWFIFVEVQGHTYNKSFEVQKYGEARLSQDSPKAALIKFSVTFLTLKSPIFCCLFVFLRCYFFGMNQCSK